MPIPDLSDSDLTNHVFAFRFPSVYLRQSEVEGLGLGVEG